MMAERASSRQGGSKLARGEALQTEDREEILASAVAVVVARARSAGDQPEAADVAAWRDRIGFIAQTYRDNADLALAAASARRPGAVLNEVSELVSAARTFAARLANLSPVASGAIHGDLKVLRGFSAIFSEQDGRRLAAAFRIVSRYDLPFSRVDAGAECRELYREVASLNGSDERSLDLARLRISWPAAVLALADLVELRSRRFDRMWAPQRTRRRDVVDHGPLGSLGKRGDAIPRAPDVGEVSRNRRDDLGGKLDLFEDEWGNPKWNLCRDSWCLLADAAPISAKPVTGHWSSPLAKLVQAVFFYATGDDPGAGSSRFGLDHSIQNAAKIMGALSRENDRLSAAAAQRWTVRPFADREQYDSLMEAAQTGEVPKWLDDQRVRRPRSA